MTAPGNFENILERPSQQTEWPHESISFAGLNSIIDLVLTAARFSGTRRLDNKPISCNIIHIEMSSSSMLRFYGTKLRIHLETIEVRNSFVWKYGYACSLCTECNLLRMLKIHRRDTAEETEGLI